MYRDWQCETKASVLSLVAITSFLCLDINEVTLPVASKRSFVTVLIAGNHFQGKMYFSVIAVFLNHKIAECNRNSILLLLVVHQCSVSETRCDTCPLILGLLIRTQGVGLKCLIDSAAWFEQCLRSMFDPVFHVNHVVFVCPISFAPFQISLVLLC